MEVIKPPLNHSYKWKRILLIKPNYRTTGWDYYNMDFPPINLTSIASYLTDLEVEVNILDAKILNLNYRKLKKKIAKFNPDLVGVSVFVSASINLCYDVARAVKEVNPDCVVVFGGRHPTWVPEETLGVKEVDYLVRGEGELTFRELIINGSPENINGISYKSNGKIVHNPDRALLQDFANIRFPARHLTKGNKYKMFTVRLETIETSRGCPHKCVFCTTHKFNNGLWRPRPVDRIITELKMISHNRRITDIFFVDDNLTANTNRIIELCDKIIKCKEKREINDFKFFAQIRVDSVVKSPEMVKKMAEAGFWVVFIGVESVSEETLKEMNKGLTFDKVLDGLKILHDNDILVIGNLIIGVNLNASEEDMKKEMQFIKDVDIDIVSYVLLTPFPGSDTLKELEEKNLVITKDWSKYTVFDPVIRTNKLNPKELYDLLYYSFRELKYFNHYRQIISRIKKTRGLSFLLNPRRWLAMMNSFLKVRPLFMEFDDPNR